MPASHPERRPAWALALATILVFLPIAGNGFINLDDSTYILENPFLRQGLTPPGVWWALTSTEHYNWYPLTRLMHLANMRLFGSWAGGHHLVSLAFHAGSATLLALTLARMTGALWASAFTAAVFALHPLRVESVAWASELSDALATWFVIATIALHHRYARHGRRSDYAGLVAAFGLSLLAKPTAVTLPFLLLLLDGWPLNRFPGGWKVLIREKLPLAGMSAAVAMVTFLAQRRGGSIASLAVVPLDQRLANAALAAVGYLGKLLWPVGLSPFYPHPGGGVSRPAAIAAALALAGLTYFILARRRSVPWLSTGWAWYIVTLVPVVGLVQVGQQAMADRYTYLPSIGAVLAIVWSVDRRSGPSSASRALLVAGAAAYLLFLAVLTPQQIRHWRDSRALFTHALTVDPDNWLAHLKLAEAARDEGNVAAALAHLERTVAVAPDNVRAWTLLGVSLEKAGRPGDALRALEEAVQRGPTHVDARHDLALVLANFGRSAEAISQLRVELFFDPASLRARKALAALLLEAGALGEAEALCREVLGRHPDDPEALALAAGIGRARGQGSGR